MHQSFVVPGNSGVLTFPAKGPALRGQTYGKIPAKSPYPTPEVDKNEKQQIKWTI